MMTGHFRKDGAQCMNVFKQGTVMKGRRFSLIIFFNSLTFFPHFYLLLWDRTQQIRWIYVKKAFLFLSGCDEHDRDRRLHLPTCFQRRLTFHASDYGRHNSDDCTSHALVFLTHSDVNSVNARGGDASHEWRTENGHDGSPCSRPCYCRWPHFSKIVFVKLGTPAKGQCQRRLTQMWAT